MKNSIHAKGGNDTPVYSRRSIITCLACVCIFFGVTRVSASSDTGWIIDSFHSDITINENTSIEIVETISTDFYDLNKHGIYRDIPIVYKTASGNNIDLKFNLHGVSDVDGNLLSTSVKKSGNKMTIRIGDPDTTVTGKQTYVISYGLTRGLTQPGSTAEFYWNVNGTDWPVIITKPTATIHAPKGSIIDTVCFAGFYGTSTSDCKINYQQDVVVIESRYLNPGENFTLAVSLDKNKLIFPSINQEILWFVQDNVIYISPLFVFLIMLYLYMKNGRDRKFKNIFFEQAGVDFVSPFERVRESFIYKPIDNLSPGEVGLLVDERVHMRDITAITIDLARKGYFKIKEIKKGKIFKTTEYELTFSGLNEDALKDFEKSVLDMLFSPTRSKDTLVSLNKLPKDAYKYQQDIKDKLYNNMTQNKFFHGNPNSVRNKYVVWGVVILISFIALSTLTAKYPFLSVGGFVFSGILSCVIIIVFGIFMPARTAKGRKLLSDVVGLREYVRVGLWRQKKYELWNYFEEILPYTIAFGLTHKFIDAFEDAKIKPPDWYQSSGNFNPSLFIGALGNFDNTFSQGINATRPKSASSGGSGFSGGFSGGGFGGGGGGSW
ncbi:DUF2207 domain-containing protein [Candidatus Woesebacteria bacterium]|nr:MAG: DUF2207 domain-containing protein [Candidatus Woesebacteria bacterium]